MAADNPTGPASTENPPPPPAQLTPAEQIIALQAENRLLRELRDHSKPKGPDHRVGRKPESFKGTPADKDTHAVQQWLSRMDTYWRLAGVDNDRPKRWR